MVSAAGEREQSLGVDHALGPLLEVVVARRARPHHRGLRAHVEDVPQALVVALEPVIVAGAAAGGGAICRAGSFGLSVNNSAIEASER